MNILVTGSNGQLGNEMQQLSKQSANNYYFTDVAEIDITNIEAIRTFVNNHDIQTIINCAAYTNVDKAEDDFEIADLINNKAVENLAIVCKEHDATLFHVSTDYVFLGNKNLPCKEDEPTDPIGAYGKTKLAGEQSIDRVGCKALIFRTAWLYSIYGNNFVKTMQRLTNERENLTVVFDQVGTPTHAADLAQAIFSIIENNQYAGNEGKIGRAHV